MQPVYEAWVSSPWTFSDRNEAWRAFLASDQGQMLLQILPEAQFKQVVYDALRPFQNEDGSGTIRRQFRYVVATEALY